MVAQPQAEGTVAATAPSLLYAIKQVELAIRAHLDELLRPSGTTVQQYTALTVLDRRDGLTTAELARNSFVTPQAMGDLVNALERRMLVLRRRDPMHGRRLLISLTGSGRELLAAVAAEVDALERRMVRGFTADERIAFGRFLHKAGKSLAAEPPSR